MNTPLHLSAERVRETLFRGGFRPMDKNDFMAFADAPAGSLIADIKVGRHEYTVLFDVTMGEFEIIQFHLNGESNAWTMDGLTGQTIEL